MKLVFFILLFFSTEIYSQNRNSVWCFGDSAGIDFSIISNPQAIHSNLKTRGSCASICDSLGSLLFYSGYNPQTIWGGPPNYNGEIYNKNNNLMQNGDLIITQAWYQEQVIVPMPNDAAKYYLFTVNVTGSLGLYYSVIDIVQDSGKGSVILKNVQLINYKACDGVMSIKHANGRDWWVISKRWDSSNNEYYKFLVTPSGISGPTILNIGSFSNEGLFWFTVSMSGNNFIWFDLAGLIELYDFDRCTGSIGLNTTIASELFSSPYPWYTGAAFSPNEQLLYISKYSDSLPIHPSFLIQFDLNAPDIFASADTIWSYYTTPVAGGALRLAPDGKIYMTCAYHDGVNFNYPYPDSTFNQVNNNLSVINYPDSPGVACGFTPFSFNLGAGRTYWGLPNNPDYELGPVSGSICDTLSVGSPELGVGSKTAIHVYYHSGWQIAFINAEGLKGKYYSLSVFDLMGKEIFRQEGILQSPYFTKDLKCESFAKGMYVVSLKTEREALSGKFIMD